jgi:hypothetical protein
MEELQSVLRAGEQKKSASSATEPKEFESDDSSMLAIDTAFLNSGEREEELCYPTKAEPALRYLLIAALCR